MPGSSGFDREKFLLRAVAGIFIAQFGLYAAGLGVCFHLGRQQLQRAACASYPETPAAHVRDGTGHSPGAAGGQQPGSRAAQRTRMADAGGLRELA